MPLPLDLEGRPEERVLRQLVGALLFEGIVDAREHIQGDAVEFQWSLGGRDYHCRGAIGPFGRLRLVPGSVEVREGADNWITPALAQLVVHLATAPKSNAVYAAFGAAMRAAKETGSLMPPKHILNAPTKLMQEIGYGSGYEYDHDAEEAFSGQDYFPEEMRRQAFYRPTDRGAEAAIAERMARWDQMRRKPRRG